MTGKKKLLILGAGVYQVPLIQRAVQRGLHVIAASWSGTDPGMAYASETWVVDTRDREELYRLSRANAIDALVTTGTDVAVPAIGYICDRLGLPGVSFETAMAATDKAVMQKKFKEFKVPSARCTVVGNHDQAVESALKFGFPVIVKAPDSSGSRGINRADNPEELEAAVDSAFDVSRAGYVLVEKYITGVEFGAQAVVVEGRMEKLICHNDTVTPPPVSVPIGHSCPLVMDSWVKEKTAGVCERGVAAIGMVNGICNIDLMFDGSDVYMLEIGARIGATGIPEIIDLSLGINLFDAAIDIALGKRPILDETRNRAAAIRVITSGQNGRLKGIGCLDSLRSLERVVAISLDCSPGDNVRRFVTGPDRVGDVFCLGDTPEQAEALCSHVASTIVLDICPCS